MLGLTYAKYLTTITQLAAYARNIQSAAGLEHVRGLTSLNLRRNAITDVSPLLSLTKLNVLDLRENPALADVSPLLGLTKLGLLALAGTAVTDAGVASLTASLTNLTWVHLEDTAITDVGVASLANLTKLETLVLDRTAITDVSPLLSLTELQDLWLHGTSLNDESINTHIPELKARGVTVRR